MDARPLLLVDASSGCVRLIVATLTALRIKPTSASKDGIGRSSGVPALSLSEVFVTVVEDDDDVDDSLGATGGGGRSEIAF